MTFCLLLILTLSSLSAFCQSTTVAGCSPYHACSELNFYEYKEGLFNTKNLIFKVSPDSSGYFNTDIKLKETKFLFIDEDEGLYYFYAEPGKSYYLNLTEVMKIHPERQKNPFSSAFTIHLPVSPSENTASFDSAEINTVIREYDEIFNPFYDNHILRYLSPELSRAKLDSFLHVSAAIEQKYPDEYFQNYIFYKKGLLEFSISQFNMRDIIDRYFAGRAVLSNVPSYWDLFNIVFDKYFNYLNNDAEYKGLYLSMSEGKYTELDSLLMKDPALKNDTIRGLVLLKELHEEFHSGNIPAGSIISLLDAIHEKSASEECRVLALTIKNKNTRLMAGSEVPDLWLTDLEGNVFNVSEIKGKLIYLGFCNLLLSECQKEFEYLKYYQNAFAGDLLIITVLENITDYNPEFLKEKLNYNWTIARSNDPDKALREYNVKALPFFYLIGYDGRFLESPAGLPSSGFERVIYQTVNDYKKKGSLRDDAFFNDIHNR